MSVCVIRGADQTVSSSVGVVNASARALQRHNVLSEKRDLY